MSGSVDLKVYCPLISDSSHSLLQSTIDGVLKWCEINGMSLSITKCVVLKFGKEYINYTIGKNDLPTSNVCRDLGVLVTPNLDFSNHIHNKVKSASILINTLFRCFINKNPSFYIHLYKSLILSKFL